MNTFSTNITKFTTAMRDLQKHAGVSTRTLVKNEARLLSEELAKRFSPRMPKAERGVKLDRKAAYITRKSGTASIPYARLDRIIKRMRPGGRLPVVAASVAFPAERRAIKALGTLAAGFIGTGNKLRAKAKTFVSRHIGESHGSVMVREGLLNTSVTITNRTPWLGTVRGREWLVRRAISYRTAAMKRNARLVALGVVRYMRGK